MPFPEKHLAPFVVTFQNLYVSLSPRILVLVNSELPCLWNVFVNFNGAEVKLLTVFDRYLSSIRNLISYLFVRNVMLANLRGKLGGVHETELSVPPWSVVFYFTLLEVAGTNVLLDEKVNLLSLVWLNYRLCLLLGERQELFYASVHFLL